MLASHSATYQTPKLDVPASIRNTSIPPYPYRDAIHGISPARISFRNIPGAVHGILLAIRAVTFAHTSGFYLHSPIKKHKRTSSFALKHRQRLRKTFAKLKMPHRKRRPYQIISANTNPISPNASRQQQLTQAAPVCNRSTSLKRTW
jgi:hypothetical protein